MDLFGWLGQVFDAHQAQQEQLQDNPNAPVTVVQAPSNGEDVLTLPDWTPGPADIPSNLYPVPDAKELDAYEIFAAGIHNDFTTEQLGLGFDAAYVGSYEDGDGVDWGADYNVVESDRMPGTYHVFKAAPVAVFPEGGDTPDASANIPTDEATAPDVSGSTVAPAMPAPVAKKSTAHKAKQQQQQQQQAQTSQQAKPAKAVKVKVQRVKPAPVAAAAPVKAPAPVPQAAAPQPQITSRSAMFRPWAQAAAGNSLP